MFKLCSLFMILSAINQALLGDTLSVGAPAPQVSGVDNSGEVVDLGAVMQSGTTLLFFYPKAMTPGCTQQACSLRDNWSLLQERAVKVYGISSDSVESQQKFLSRHNFPFPLIADTDKRIAKAFGKSRWSRHAYLFHNGKLVWLDTSASTRQQADDVLQALDTLDLK
jgi:peroxiredoxin Q/BCP